MIRHVTRDAFAHGGRVTVGVVIGSTVLVVGGAFAAGLGALGVPLRYPLAALLAIVAVLTLLEFRPSTTRRIALVTVPVWTIGVAGFCALVSPLDPSDNDALFRYALLYPLAAMAGALLALSRYRPWLGRVFVGWATVFALLAIVEFVFRIHLVPGPGHPGLVRDGLLRAVVAAEHPLVLAALLAMALPFLWNAHVALSVRIGGSAILTLGILATGSRGALALVGLAIAVAVVVRVWPARSRGRAVTRIAIGIAVAAVVALVLLVVGFPTWDVLTSDDPETASLQYRVVLYQKVLESLGTHPFGWGLGGLPAGVFVVPSQFGPIDLSTTIDSEVALLAFDAGAVGLGLFVALLSYLVSRHVLASSAGQSALIVSVAGLYVAIHAWTGLGLAAALVVGAAIAIDRTDAPSSATKLNG